MKYLHIIYPLAICLFVAFSCKKEPPTLGEQLEGDWLVRSFLYNEQEYLLEDDSFTIIFRDYKNGKGETYWFRRTFLISLIDSSGGVYSINTQENGMSIKWSNIQFWGTYPDANFQISRFSNDTLVLDEEVPGVKHYNITAVRN
jgi:hypothetical protein